MRLRHGIPIHALAAGLLCAAGAPAAIAQPPPGTAAAQSASITGTIWRVDSRAGTLDLLTGVGHSVRVTRIHFATGLKVKAGAADLGVSAFAPGTICRFACESTPSGAIAVGAEVVRTAGGKAQ